MRDADHQHLPPGSPPRVAEGEVDSGTKGERAPEHEAFAEPDGEALGHASDIYSQDEQMRRAYESLRRNHRALLRSYSAALDTLARLQQNRSDLHGLAAWALRTTSSGWALIHHGEIRVTNFAFDRLDKSADRPDGWREMERTPGSRQGNGIAFASLRLLALSEARLLNESQEAIRTARFVSGSAVVEMSVERTMAESGETTTLAVVRAIDRLVKMEEEVATMQRNILQQQSMRVLGELSVGVAHDLKNLLAALSYRMAALELTTAIHDAAGDNLEAMNRILRSGQTLVTKLQSIAHPAEAAPTAVDLRSVIASAVEVAQSSFKSGVEHAIAVNIELPALPKVWGSPDDLRNLFLNLLLNARDAMPAGGTITIAAEISSDAIVVRVEDEGTGIPDVYLERVFEPFFSTKGTKGAGIGLALARETMSRAGGQIAAHNLPSRGACIELRFVPARPRALAT
jgi:signal transduction histidine kinase